MDNKTGRNSQSQARSRTRNEPPGQTSQEQDDGERPTRMSPRRVRSHSSERFSHRFPTFQAPGLSRTGSPMLEASQVLSRDYAEQTSTSPTRIRGPRTAAFSVGPSSIRRRAGSIHTSTYPSPGPSHSWRDVYQSSRRSVAIGGPSVRDDDTATHKFSLAGPPTIDTVISNQPYVDPGYTQLNPAYDQPANVRPVWSLAKPLPRVLRPGMVPAKDELQQELQAEQDEQQDTDELIDLESGRIEPSLRPDKVTSQLESIRRERELSLFRTYRQRFGSPTLSPFGHHRRSSDVPTERLDSGRLGNTIIEESESRHSLRHEPSELQLPQLRQAIANVNQAKEEESLKVPYQDAVPLPAYNAEDDEIHNLHTYWSVVRLRFREPLAELLAITVQYTLGFSVNMSMTVSRGAAGVNDTAAWAWGFAAMIAIYIAGGISGAHLNPAITLMLYIYRGFPLRKAPVYIVAQLLGAFLAALIAFGLFQPGLLALQQEQERLFASQNQNVASSSLPSFQILPEPAILLNFITSRRMPWVDESTAFLTELTGTTVLVITVLALGDDANAPPGAGMNAFIVGLLVTVLGMAFGYNTGLAMNPIRDFGPRLAMLALGYGRDGSLFEDGYWFRVAWLGPICGAILGGFLYDAAIFVGGESPVNYPAVRVRRATRKWRKRWRARIGRTSKVVKDVKNDLVQPGYETIEGR